MKIYKTAYKKERINARCIENGDIRIAGRGYSLYINKQNIKRKMLCAIKFLLYIIATLIIFKLGQAAAYKSRGYHAVGGEIFILFLPILVPLIKRSIKDLKEIF